MKRHLRRLPHRGFVVFGLTVDLVIAVVGGLVGAAFGGAAFNSVGVESYGPFGILIAATVGAFILVFLANIIHIVAGPKGL